MSTSRQPAQPVQQPVPVPPMPLTAPTTGPTVNLRMPEPFTRDRVAFKLFMQDCFLYMAHYGTAFNNDEKKIIFVLSHITGGMARAWKETWLTKKIASNNLGTFNEFKQVLTAKFSALDKGDTH